MWTAGRRWMVWVVGVGLLTGGCGGADSRPAGSDGEDGETELAPPPEEVVEATEPPPADVEVAEEAPGDRDVDPALPEDAGTDPDPVDLPAEPPGFERPEHVRGLYLNAWASGSPRRVEALLAMADTTEINAFVIDIKDASGYVSHASGVPLARASGALGELRIRDLPGLLKRLSDAGIYPIARIVLVKDPILAEARPDLAVQDTAGGVWVDGKGIRWLNPYHPEVQAYHVALAREVAELGFPEIQWDYVRFPDAPRHELEAAVFPGSGGMSKARAIRDFLQYSQEELADLDVQVTADVFGVTTSAHDVGIGQVWEEFIDVVDVALPMVYPSHYWTGSFGFEKPNAHPYEIVRRALEDALVRSDSVEGAGITRPWLQAFSLGEPPYGAPEVRAQMQAGYDIGIHGWILWNPSSRYDAAWLEPARGFEEEPLIRAGGRVVPLSERFAALEAAERARDSVEVVPPIEVESDTAASVADTAGVVPDTDSLTMVLDSLLKSGNDTLPDTLGRF